MKSGMLNLTAEEANLILQMFNWAEEVLIERNYAGPIVQIHDFKKKVKNFLKEINWEAK